MTRHDKFEKTGLNNWSSRKSLKRETDTGVRRGKRSLLACHIRNKYCMEITRYSANVKLGIKVVKSV